MDFTPIKERFAARYAERILTVDSHTAGERTRFVLGLSIPGATMGEKLAHFQKNSDRIRRVLTWEPRGGRDVFGIVLTDPVTPGASFGLLYMDARRYPFLCGHATMGAVTTLVELGFLDPGGNPGTVTVDTPSGPMACRVEFDGHKVRSVAIQAVPSFVHETGREIEVPALGRIQVDTVCVGGFFVMVSAEQAGLDLSPSHSRYLTETGMAIIEAANEQLTVRHPTRPEVGTVDVVEFYRHEPGENRGTGIVIYGESHLDRSPCGTGTSAKLTLLHHQQKIKTGEIYTNSGPLGTEFEARVIREIRIGEREGVVVEIKGAAHLTGLHEFVIDPDDPFQEGYLL